MKTLKDVTVKITDGSHNPPKKSDQGIPMYSAQNVFNGSLVLDSFRLIKNEDFDKEFKRAPVEAGDILLTIVGTIGRSYVVKETDGKFALQRSVALIKPNPDLIDSRFLCYYLQSEYSLQYLNSNSRGVAQKGIYLGLVREMPVPVPLLDVQRRVVAKIEALLSELDDGIRNVELAFGKTPVNIESQVSTLRKSVLKKFFSVEELAKEPVDE